MGVKKPDHEIAEEMRVLDESLFEFKSKNTITCKCRKRVEFPRVKNFKTELLNHSSPIKEAHRKNKGLQAHVDAYKNCLNYELRRTIQDIHMEENVVVNDMSKTSEVSPITVERLKQEHDKRRRQRELRGVAIHLATTHKRNLIQDRWNVRETAASAISNKPQVPNRSIKTPVIRNRTPANGIKGASIATKKTQTGGRVSNVPQRALPTHLPPVQAPPPATTVLDRLINIDSMDEEFENYMDWLRYYKREVFDLVKEDADRRILENAFRFVFKAPSLYKHYREPVGRHRDIAPINMEALARRIENEESDAVPVPHVVIAHSQGDEKMRRETQAKAVTDEKVRHFCTPHSPAKKKTNQKKETYTSPEVRKFSSLPPLITTGLHGIKLSPEIVQGQGQKINKHLQLPKL